MKSTEFGIREEEEKAFLVSIDEDTGSTQGETGREDLKGFC